MKQGLDLARLRQDWAVDEVLWRGLTLGIRLFITDFALNNRFLQKNWL